MSRTRTMFLTGAVVVSLLCGASPSARAMPGLQTCKSAEDAQKAAVDLTKEAFFSAMESAGTRLYEEGIDRASLGLDSGNAAMARSGVKLAQTGTAIKRATTFIAGFDGLILSPINEYLENPTEEGRAKALATFLTNAATMTLAKAGESVLSSTTYGSMGLVIEGGNLVIGTSKWAVSEMIDQGQRQALEASIFGRSLDTALGTINNVPAQAPFFTTGPAWNRGLTPENIGLKVRSEEELFVIWQLHGSFLKGGVLSTQSGKKSVDKLIDEGWPILRKYWSFRRASAFMTASDAAFAREMNRVQAQIARGEVPACTTQNTTPAGPPAQPVKGAFGPPIKTFGHAAPNFENHEQKITATMTASSFSVTLERKPSSEGSITISHKFGNAPPDILKPGDIVDLTCESEGKSSGRYPPLIGGGCHWEVEGSVTLLPESTKGSFAGMASDGKLYPAGASRTRFKVGTGGKLLIRAVQGGFLWGSTDNWNPAQYVYTFVP